MHFGCRFTFRFNGGFVCIDGGWFHTGRDNIKLYTRKYIPSGAFSVVFLFLHGVGEHCSRFHDTFSSIAKQGIAVYAMDNQGHGQSGGPRFDCGSFDEFTNDIFTYNDIIRRENASYVYSSRTNLSFTAFTCRNTRVKYVIGGFSFGGLLAATVAALKPEMWDGLLLFAPAVGNEKSWLIWFQTLLAPVLEFLIPTWEVVPAVIPERRCLLLCNEISISL